MSSTIVWLLLLSKRPGFNLALLFVMDQFEKFFLDKNKDQKNNMSHILLTDHDYTVSPFVGISVKSICLKDARDVVSSWIVVLLKQVAKLVFCGAHEACI